ncbi:MAG: alpha/beta hydrolase [Anaerolineae bacterium]|nr:alpha/beta hydrolase [Anaerolineae bacterium]
MEYTVKDVTLYYEIHGSGMPVLMIHGWSPDHRLMKGCMEPIFQSLEKPWMRVYFDLPGMGKTPGKPWITGSDPMLEVILGFIDGVIPNRPFLVAGESYGGYLARGLVKKRPEMVNGLLLICPLKTPYVVTPEGVDKGDVPEVLQVLERDEALLQSLSPADRESFTAINVLQTPRVWERFRDEIMPGLQLADTDFLSHTLGQAVPFSFDVDALEPPYTKPTLILMGRQDTSVGYRDQWQLIEGYPRASFVVLDKAGHNLQIEQDMLFARLVKEWLDRVSAES